MNHTNSSISSFSLSLLVKDWVFFSVFLLVALVVSFTTFNTNLYGLLYSGIDIFSFSARPDNQFWIILALAILIICLNLSIIYGLLFNAYILKRQVKGASLLIFFGFGVAVGIGFYARIFLESYVSDNSSINPDFLTIFAMAMLSLPLFVSVYGLATGRYSRVDYAPARQKLLKLFECLDEKKEKIDKGGVLAFLKKDLDELLKCIKGTETALEDAGRYESERYKGFVKDCLLQPLSKLRDCANDKNLQGTPSNFADIYKDENTGYLNNNEKLKNGKQAYRKLLDYKDG